MTPITITLTDEVMDKLGALTRRHDSTPEDFIREKIEELVKTSTGPTDKEPFQETLKFIDETYGKYAGNVSLLRALMEEKATTHRE